MPGQARKKPSKGLTIESFQGSIKVLQHCPQGLRLLCQALATLKLDGDLSPLDAVCGLVTLLAPVEVGTLAPAAVASPCCLKAVVKFRGADSLDILVPPSVGTLWLWLSCPVLRGAHPAKVEQVGSRPVCRQH